MDIDEVKKKVIVTDYIRHIIGDDPDREGLAETPSRVIKAAQELFGGYKMNLPEVFKTFASTVDEMIVVKNIDFVSHCEHHLMPFEGVVHIGYLPSGRVLGLSKFARVVEVFSKRAQIQERMTSQIAEAMQVHLKPKGVGVIVVAKHNCMRCRGVKQKNSEMLTASMKGCFLEPGTKGEFYALTGVAQ